MLGSLSTRIPKTLLKWNAKKLTFNVKEANHFVRRNNRKGWEVEELS